MIAALAQREVRTAFLLAALALLLGACTTSPQDECDLPVEERSGGWFCYEPEPSPT